MAATDTTALAVASREPSGSREVRRLRRRGRVPGVVYGGGADPVSFEIDARELRQALAHSGAVLDLQVDGAKGSPVVIKELAHHPVNGEIMHVDLLRVRLDVAIQTTVPVELVGADDAPGVKSGGVLEHVTRELTVEALPNDIPDVITHDISTMDVGDTLTLQSIAASTKYTVIGDAETVIATVTAPRLQAEADEIEQETEVVGEGQPSAADEEPAAGESGGEGPGEGGE